MVLAAAVQSSVCAGTSVGTTSVRTANVEGFLVAVQVRAYGTAYVVRDVECFVATVWVCKYEGMMLSYESASTEVCLRIHRTEGGTEG